MKIENEIVIVTPTYNRRNTLPKLYQSLTKQSCKGFIWLIIDDGSVDETKEYVDFILKENLIKIIYVYQNNGGKGRALNNAFSRSDLGQFFVVVDSDDYLLNNALEIIREYIIKYKNSENIGAFFFHYQTEEGTILKSSGSVFSSDVVMTRYEYNAKYTQNDGCVCYFNEVIRNYKYPEFEGEKYVGPTIIQLLMATKYSMVFSPQVIGVADYQDNGLTKLGRRLRLQNPLGMLYYSGLQQSTQASLRTRIKNKISAQAYRFFANCNKKSLENYKLTKYLQIWALFPGFLLQLYWKLKYAKVKAR